MSSLAVGIIGLPNVGKSTLFNAIMGRQQALTAPYPFATVEPNIGVIDVPDDRIEKLCRAMAADPRSEVTETTPLVYSSITFVDIAGLVKGAAEGHGLGNQFLANIRDVDLILHVLRDFDPSDDSGQVPVPRAAGSVDPEHDAVIVETELELKDLELTEKNPDYSDWLSKKPVIYAVNVGEQKLKSTASTDPSTLMQFAQDEKRKAFIFCAKLEEQISQLPKIEQLEYLKLFGQKSSGLDRIITESFSRLGLISFFTAGKIEVRAWPIRKGFSAPKASGVIHSDFEKLFIRAEVTGWEKLADAGSWQAAKEKGIVRTEGRDYLIQDGDVCNFLIGK